MVICLLLALGGVAYAAYSKSLECHVRIVQAPGPQPQIALAFFQDEACAQPCTFVEWGEKIQGAVVVRTEMFYIKNVGDLSATISGNSTFPANAGTLALEFKKGTDWQSTLALGIGGVCEVKGILDIKNNAPLGDVSFEIIIGA